MAMDELATIQDEVFTTLDAVRESGKINMFGAAPYLQEWFGISAPAARYLLGEWMRTFGERHKEVDDSLE